MKHRTAVSAIALLLLLLIGGWLGVRWAGDAGFRRGTAEGAAARERLQLVWPDVPQMPDDDRLVLMDLAMRCGLHEQPLVAQNIVHCLRSAASEADAAKHHAVLERLIPSQYAAPPDTK